MAIGIAKRTILHCKTGTFGTQNWHFWNAKLALLECKMHRFAKWFALIKVLERMLCAYNQILILHMNYGAFSSPPLWGGREGLFFWGSKGLYLPFKTLIINSLKEIFALTNALDAAFVIVHSHEKRGSDRKCINIHFNNLGYTFPDYLMNFHKKMGRGNSARAACTPFTPYLILFSSGLCSPAEFQIPPRVPFLSVQHPRPWFVAGRREWGSWVNSYPRSSLYSGSCSS